jgi:LPS-assembly lipoprotein
MSKRIPATTSVSAEPVEARSGSSYFDRRSTNGLGGVLALALLAGTLSACGLQPLYSGGSQGAVSNVLGAVTVDPIEGKNGWLMRNALNDRLTAGGTTTTRYKLTIKLDDQIEGFGIRADDTVTRERRTLRARYQLIDLESGKTVLDATAGSDAGIDVVSSEYATIAGENTALENLTQEVAEQIVTRISIYAREPK